MSQPTGSLRQSGTGAGGNASTLTAHGGVAGASPGDGTAAASGTTGGASGAGASGAASVDHAEDDDFQPSEGAGDGGIGVEAQGDGASGVTGRATGTTGCEPGTTTLPWSRPQPEHVSVVSGLSVEQCGHFQPLAILVIPR